MENEVEIKIKDFSCRHLGCSVVVFRHYVSPMHAEARCPACSDVGAMLTYPFRTGMEPGAHAAGPAEPSGELVKRKQTLTFADGTKWEVTCAVTVSRACE